MTTPTTPALTEARGETKSGAQLYAELCNWLIDQEGHNHLYPEIARTRSSIQGEQPCQAVSGNTEGKVPTTAPEDTTTPLSGNLAGEGGDYFCQWCYDRGLRYPDDGKPWAHAFDCPNRKGGDCPFCKGQDFENNAHPGHSPFVCPHCSMTPPDTQIHIHNLESEEQATREIILDTLRQIGVTATIDEECRLTDAADYLRDQVKERMAYLNAAHRIGAQNVADSRQEIHRLRVEHDERVAEIEQLKEQLKSLPADWRKDSSLERWFPLTAVRIMQREILIADLKAEVELAKGCVAEAAKFESIRNGDLVQKLDVALESLKLAYARGHYCDQQPCPGCEAGIALEKITGRKWTQGECGDVAALSAPQVATQPSKDVPKEGEGE